MAHPQNSPRGLFAKDQANITTLVPAIDGDSVVFENGLLIGTSDTAQITANTTGIILAGAIRINDVAAGQVSANSTALIIPVAAKIGTQTLTSNSTAITITGGPTGLPSAAAGSIAFGSNTTGQWMGIRLTDTSWAYFNTTSVQPS